ncbi:recombinase family protein [Lacisediminihabitans profunda]|uniref:Recombinase family protein n=1 Tax=Lacisediminihabitans profunda TaxID=2594790 RepID=A0A5C8UN58_9MICO|nr:recombinase family protein [Lacisediminihabitans profunda]TXN29816.1 recombinase family protein [Lacisediminihabitans profunda]
MVVEQGAIGANARPGRTGRTVIYPAFARTGPQEPARGTKPVYLYLRLSKYHRDGADAIERQRIDLHRKLLADGGWTVMGEYIDNDSASSSAVRSRKAWRQLNNDIRSGLVKAVAFWKLDRTNRVASRCIEWIGECQRSGVYLVSHQDSAEELNTATAGAKLVMGIKALLAEVETDSMSERQLAAKRHLAEAGFHHGGTSPFGWKPGPRVTDHLGRSGVRLVPHPIEFPALRDAVTMVLAGKSLSAIGKYWKDRYEITTASGGFVYEASIYRSLVSPRMVGYRMRQVPEHQRGIKIDLLNHIALDATGNPVVSQEPVCDLVTWMRVRHLLEQARTSNVRKPWGSHEWLLTGLAFCQCGNRLYGHNKSRRNNHGERIQAYAYRCMANRNRGPGNCPGSCTVDAEKAEAFVLGWFFAQVTDESLANARARRRVGRTGSEAATILAELEQTKQERQALIRKQGSADYRGSMVTVLLQLIEDTQLRIEDLQRRLDVLALEEFPIRDGSGLVAAWPGLTIGEKRGYLRRLIHRIDALPGNAPSQDRLTITPVG